MKVGILSDGKPGHLNQSLGIANILAEDLELDIITIDLLVKNPLLKPFLRFYQRFLCQNFNEINANKIINLFTPIAVSDFDLLIATGGNTAYILLHLEKNIILR